MLYAQINIMIAINPINSLFTVSPSILLLIFRPTIPPRIPPATISIRSPAVNSGTVFVTIVLIRLVICENRMIYREFCAAVLVSIEKKKNRTTRLIGPPPIPRKEEQIPSATPIKMHASAFCTW